MSSLHAQLRFSNAERSSAKEATATPFVLPRDGHPDLFDNQYHISSTTNGVILCDKDFLPRARSSECRNNRLEDKVPSLS